MININDISFKYGKKVILDSLSFSVKAGEFFIIIGPNGSGKTTLLKIIANLLTPFKGDVSVLGKKVCDYKTKELAKKISFVFQNASSNFPFTVEEIVSLGRFPYLNILGIEKDDDSNIIKKAMLQSDINHFADRKIEDLSGGEQKRVFIAKAICQKTEVILLDEPTNTLDISHQIKIMNLMQEMKKNICVIMVLHDINLASMYADKILLMNKGRIEDIGHPSSVIKKEKLEKVYGCNLFIDVAPVQNFNRVTLVKN